MNGINTSEIAYNNVATLFLITTTTSVQEGLPIHNNGVYIS